MASRPSSAISSTPRPQAPKSKAKPVYRCWCGAYACYGIKHGEEWYCPTHYTLTAEGQSQVARRLAELSKETET